MEICTVNQQLSVTLSLYQNELSTYSTVNIPQNTGLGLVFSIMQDNLDEFTRNPEHLHLLFSHSKDLES